MVPKTIIITKVETIETDMDYFKLRHYAEEQKVYGFDCEFDVRLFDPYEIIEHIKGQRYIDKARGIDVVIGSSVEAKNALLAQYRSWKLTEEVLAHRATKAEGDLLNVERKLRESMKTIDELYNKTKKVLQSGFLTRLKWLFTGVNI